jgi:hypothetical protein
LSQGNAARSGHHNGDHHNGKFDFDFHSVSPLLFLYKNCSIFFLLSKYSSLLNFSQRLFRLSNTDSIRLLLSSGSGFCMVKSLPASLNVAHERGCAVWVIMTSPFCYRKIVPYPKRQIKKKIWVQLFKV